MARALDPQTVGAIDARVGQIVSGLGKRRGGVPKELRARNVDRLIVHEATPVLQGPNANRGIVV